MSKEFKAPTRKNVIERATKKGKKSAWLFTLNGDKLNELTKDEQRSERNKLRKDLENKYLSNIFSNKDMDSYLDFCDFLNSYSVLSFNKNGLIPVNDIIATFSANSYIQNNASKLQKIYDTLFVDKKKK